MRRTLRIFVPLLCLGAMTLCLAAHAQDGPATENLRRGATTILSFDSMIGNPGNGDPANVIRGFSGAGSPWAVAGAVHGLLRSDGQLIVVVHGLVIASGQLKDQNPVAQFRAALSCQDPTDPTMGQLFFTDLFPATTGGGARTGDSSIVGRLTLPPTCFAPLIFIGSPPSSTSPDGAWFAVTGF